MSSMSRWPVFLSTGCVPVQRRWKRSWRGCGSGASTISGFRFELLIGSTRSAVFCGLLRGCKNCEELASFDHQKTTGVRGRDACLGCEPKPELRLVRFLDDNPKLGDEFSLRPSRKDLSI